VPPVDGDDRVLVPFAHARERIGRATQVKSTLLSASLDAIRKRGRFDEYEAQLTPEHREAIVFGVSGVWLPMEIALAHYAAVDSLGFTEAEILENGYSVGTRLNHTFVGTVVKLAGQAGVTPWLPLAQVGKLFERVFRGGAGVQVERLAPKDARIEVVGLPIASSPYFRGALRGQVQVGCELFCRRCYARAVEPRHEADAVTLRVSWV
jgi:hypothetical protein